MRSISFRNMAEKKVKEYQASEEEETAHRSILGTLQEVRKKKPDEFDEYAMISAVTSNIFAGSDTTAISLRAMIHSLLSNPRYHERFCRELTERREAGLLSDPVQFHEAEAWPFLQAVMYEALRIHPPFAAPLPRVVPEGGLTTLGGLYLPPNVSKNQVPTSRDCHESLSLFPKDADQDGNTF